MTKKIHTDLEITGSLTVSGQPVAGGGSGGVFPFGRSGLLTVITGTARIYAPGGAALTLKSARASVALPPQGSSAIIKLMKNGTTELVTLTIAANDYTSGRQTFTGTLGATDYLTVDITQIGSTYAGADLTVQVEF